MVCFFNFHVNQIKVNLLWQQIQKQLLLRTAEPETARCKAPKFAAYPRQLYGQLRAGCNDVTIIIFVNRRGRGGRGPFTGGVAKLTILKSPHWHDIFPP
jgi:hypothetical protein